jgi:hypothetical protein
MADELSASGVSSIPPGFVAIPISLEQTATPLRVCVVCQAVRGAGLVPIEDTLDARAYLGCVIDAGSRVHQWLEIWVQSIANVLAAPAIARDSLSNSILDQRWQEMCAALESVSPGDAFHTGWETEPARPTWIDPKAARPLHPVEDATRKPWALCRDESALAEAGLPSYATALHRYLYVPEHPAATPFVAITPDAPTSERVQPIESLFPGRTDLLPLNPAGLMSVRRLSPLTLEEFADMLGGRPMAGNASRLPKEFAPKLTVEEGGADGDGWLFMGRHGRWGRVIESLHLRLRALSDVVRSVRTTVQRTQRPLLNLDAGQFKLRVDEPATALPWLWTARVALAGSGAAVALPIAGSAARYYTLGRASASPGYQPPQVTVASRGLGTVRVRKVIPELAEGVVVEGTLDSQQKVQAARNDLVWLRVTMPDAPLDLYSRVDPGPALAAGEWRFRTVGQRLTPQRLAQLKEGFAAAASFEVIPVLSTPVDLFSLGVLATRLFLVNSEAALPVAVDEVLSLARAVANQHDAHSPLGLRIRAIVESDPRWMVAIGPHRLAWEGLSPEQASEMVPPDLWTDVLGMIIAMFPGIGPDSAAKDYGDAPPGALHRVFDRAAGDLDRLLLRSRSLIVIDWRYNREIHAVIRGYLTGLGAPETNARAPVK